LLHDGIPRRAQINGWFDEGVGKKYMEAMPLPHFKKERCDGVLMIDRLKCHLQSSFVAEYVLWVVIKSSFQLDIHVSSSHVMLV
jgi:hypothetical protein